MEIQLGERSFVAEQQGTRHAVGSGEALISLGRLLQRDTAAEGVVAHGASSGGGRY
jgi:hypothetical protein